MASRNLSAKTPAKNIGAKAPTKTHTKGDGTIVVEKLCPMQRKTKMVDPDGNIIWLALANGFVSSIRDPYGPQILHEKLEKGFIPFAECPIAKGHVAAEGRKPCKGLDGKGKFSNAESCDHITEIALARRAKKKTKNDRYGEKFNSDSKRMLEIIEKQMANQIAMNTAAPKGKAGGIG